MSKTLPIVTTALAWLLAAFFLFGAYGNAFISAENAAAYAAWGYPDWFHYITAMLELVAGVLLIRFMTRPFGAGLGALVMGAAVLTTLVNADYDHAVAPSVILFLSLLVLGLTVTVRRTSPHDIRVRTH